MISLFVGLSPTSGSVLMAQNLESASDFVSPSLPFPLLLPHFSLSVSLPLPLSKISIKKV